MPGCRSWCWGGSICFSFSFSAISLPLSVLRTRPPSTKTLPRAWGRGGGSRSMPGHRLLVHMGLGELRELLVGHFFFLESPLEQRRMLLLAEHLGVGADRAVAGDLIVLDALR